MKKVSTLVLCTGITMTTIAQKNSILVMGSVGFDANTSEGNGPGSSKRNQFNFMPGVGYQVSDHWTLGVLGEITTYNQKTINPPNPTTTASSRQYGGGVFGRYSSPITSLLFFVAQGEAAYSTASGYINGIKAPGANPTSFEVRVYPAIGMNIKKGFALNLSVGNITYQNRKDPANGATTSGINVNMLRGFNFAMTKNFTKRKAAESVNTTSQG